MSLNWFSNVNLTKRIFKTLLLKITAAKLVLLKNTTVRNTSSGYHPVSGSSSLGIKTQSLVCFSR